MNYRAALVIVTAIFLLTDCALTSPPPASREGRIQFVTVEKNVQLEVIDWGGSGRPVVLLAGSGNTAHVFDEFAPKLTGRNHVYGITRRGFGASARPASGYDAKRLADDVVQVLDALHLKSPVMVGHSLGGYELAVLAAEYPGRVGGLVFLDATIIDPAIDDSEHITAVRRRLPAAMTVPQRMTFPQSEWSAVRSGNHEHDISPTEVQIAVHSGMQKLDYTRIRVPVLAFYALPPTIEKQVAEYQPGTADQRRAMEEAYQAAIGWSRAASGALRAGVPGSRIIELPGANHYVFLSNEVRVLSEIRAFLAAI